MESPSLGPTSTSTAEPSQAPSPTATWQLRLLYLPVLLGERCPPSQLFTDVVLVIDASTSMNERAADGRSGLEVAIEAARSFIQGLRVRTGQDRVAIVTFNEAASTLQQLTDVEPSLLAALARIRPEANSRVDLGVERAMVELVARGRSGHVQAMIVLSDGKVNQVASDRPGIVARRARLAGITIYVVGMGPSFDQRILREMASGPARYFPAPDPLLIRDIYDELSTRVPCPAEAYWGRR